MGSSGSASSSERKSGSGSYAGHTHVETDGWFGKVEHHKDGDGNYTTNYSGIRSAPRSQCFSCHIARRASAGMASGHDPVGISSAAIPGKAAKAFGKGKTPPAPPAGKAAGKGKPPASVPILSNRTKGGAVFPSLVKQGVPQPVMDAVPMCDGYEQPALDSVAVCTFYIGRMRWTTTEQYYQAAKFADDEHRQKIRTSRDLGETWRLGRQVCVERSSCFNHVETMYVAARAKFEQDLKMKAALLKTHGSIRPADDPEDLHGVTMWQHWHSRVLERVREELRPESERDEALLEALRREFLSSPGSFNEEVVAAQIREIAAEFEEMSKPRTIFGATLDGQEAELQVLPTDVLRKVKERFASALDVDATRLNLLVGEDVVDEHLTVVEAGVNDGDTVSLFVRPVSVMLSQLGGPPRLVAREEMLAAIQRMRRVQALDLAASSELR